MKWKSSKIFNILKEDVILLLNQILFLLDRLEWNNAIKVRWQKEHFTAEIYDITLRENLKIFMLMNFLYSVKLAKITALMNAVKFVIQKIVHFVSLAWIQKSSTARQTICLS